MTTTEPRIEGLNVENALALATRLRERADGLPQDELDTPLAVGHGSDPPERRDTVMHNFHSLYACGTVGCIMGEYWDWSALKPGLPKSLTDFLGASEWNIAYLSEWLSPKHRTRFLATPLLAERLRVMASYLEWLTGAAQ